MQGIGHGGFLLTCTRVFDDAEANSVTAGGRRSKKRKIETLTSVPTVMASALESSNGGSTSQSEVGNEGLGEIDLSIGHVDEVELDTTTAASS